MSTGIPAMWKACVAAGLLLFAAQADAYIGPGAGIGLLGSLWAWLVGFVVVLLAIAIWPLRWLLRRMRRRATPRAPDPTD